jgi:aminopeptidase
MNYPPFDLNRLLDTVFKPKKGEKIAILIDLQKPEDVRDFRYLEMDGHSIQKMAHKHFYLGLKNGVMDKLGLTGGELFCYKETLGSNLDLEDEAYAPDGQVLSFEKDIYPNYDILLCISTNSATAPLTASAKVHNFRGATMHGLNEIILNSGLSVDYNEVSDRAERLRQGMSNADAIEIDFMIKGKLHQLRIELNGQDAQKSHGLCRIAPDIANLPAGEVYYVPTNGEGHFPMKLEDGSIALLTVKGARVIAAEFIEGNRETVEAYDARVKSDEACGFLGELGFGTELYPIADHDIQDEKAFGTFHVATGRNDHLGGDITTEKFKDKNNATHDDILFSPVKTPEIDAPTVRLYKDGQTHILYESYQAGDYLKEVVYGEPVRNR